MRPKIALIINTFNQPAYLKRVLKGVDSQLCPPAEVLLADDGSEEETRQLFKKWAKKKSFVSRHVWQKNDGFRRSMILNKTIAASQTAYLVFLDGDTVPHPAFLEDHAQLAQPGFFVQGHRALIEEKATAWFGWGNFQQDRLKAVCSFQMSGLKHAFRWPVPAKKTRKDLRGIRGCNLAIWRHDLVLVNGYNEAFKGWGREDSELAVRLMNHAIQRRDVRGRALCYHLWHPPASRSNLNQNDDLLETAEREGSKRCQLGLDQYLKSIQGASPATAGD